MFKNFLDLKMQRKTGEDLHTLIEGDLSGNQKFWSKWKFYLEKSEKEKTEKSRPGQNHILISGHV